MKDFDIYKSIIGETLTNLGFSKEKSKVPIFDEIYYFDVMGIKITFLIKEINEDSIDYVTIEKLVNLGRTTSAELYMASMPPGINLIFLHEGQISLPKILGQVDLIYMAKRPVCQSITSINIKTGKIEQDKVWIILGIARKAIKNIKTISK